MTKNGTNEKIFEVTEDVCQDSGRLGHQVTIEKFLPLKYLLPGQYTLE